MTSLISCLRLSKHFVYFTIPATKILHTENSKCATQLFKCSLSTSGNYLVTMAAKSPLIICDINERGIILRKQTPQTIAEGTAAAVDTA